MITLPHHWDYIVASYGLVLGTALFLGVSATLRLRRARARLAQLDHRRSPAATRTTTQEEAS
ncbi:MULTISPECIES: hypothetical protein [Neokomagataea]|uniref:Heme exporter protein D n=2 Tax=Neokomagataea TaxID=1223423 RepID=A0ABQ0QLK3_9PROT|nr:MULTISPECIES: hypothetical protein [Neokomagataea]MBR0559367.1 hypothetical protein [Neokomagataea anthophila]GBR49380.1 hypothetical protein AA106556_2030 [Neokomagataea tanensis NBRC 106556]